MTSPSIFRIAAMILIIACSSGSMRPVFAASKEVKSIEHSPVVTIPAGPLPSNSSTTHLPEGGLKDKGVKSDHHKTPLKTIDELGKIHRFHKERVKKSRKHVTKLWMAALLVIVACHIALLIHAFLHLSH